MPPYHITRVHYIDHFKVCRFLAGLLIPLFKNFSFVFGSGRSHFSSMPASSRRLSRSTFTSCSFRKSRRSVQSMATSECFSLVSACSQRLVYVSGLSTIVCVPLKLLRLFMGPVSASRLLILLASLSYTATTATGRSLKTCESIKTEES